MADYNFNQPATPGFGPIGTVTPGIGGGDNPDFGPSMPSLPGVDQPATPGFGPAGPSTPTVPGIDQPATPGFGPVGPVTPTLPGPNFPSRPIYPGGSSLWSWGVIGPVFTNARAIAHVRFYNAAAIQEPIDIYMNNQLVVSNLDYTNYTDYLHVIPGTYLITIYRRTNPGVPVINARVEFVRNTTYTVTFLGTVNNFSLQLMTS